MKQYVDPHKAAVETELAKWNQFIADNDPEPYLKAWERCGFAKNECMVVENAPLGVRAGKAAELFTVAVNTGPLPDELLWNEKADVVVPNMAALLAWLQQLQ